MTDRADKYVAVGEISRPHGVRGELAVRSFAESPAVLRAGRRVRLVRPGSDAGRTCTVSGLRAHGDRLLVTLAGIEDRDAAEALRGHLLYVSARDLPRLSPGQVYRHQLIGCRVAAPGTDHPDLGVLDDILDLPGQEVWRILHPSGREILYPANPDTVSGIDPDAAVITVTPPPGLVDIYLEGDAPPAPAGPSPDPAP